uniref:Uncharacterized protein n=1 Tax=Oryza meridionalis TaxID=40149 RepID=A0A0E0E5Z5_9ORYZ
MDGRRRHGGSLDEALAVLPLDDLQLPELAPLLVAAGVCFGFADPTTNIIANTLSFLPPDHGAKKRKRKTKAPSAATATEKVPGGLTISLRAVLLDKIHAKYIKAISRLPMQDVRARYHRALINGGYCYGPFSCVTNIIVNTIWYDSAFPAVEKLEVDMICTSTFVRVESRSLRGLIKQLLTCIPEISEHDAMIYLLKNNLKVRKAIKMAGVEGWEPSWDVSAYKAAADALFHLELEAYVQFSTQSLPKVQAAVKSLLCASTPLSSNDVLQLATLLPSSNCISAKSLETIVDLSTDALDIKIEAALRKKGYLYDLQMNFLDFKCPYSHVNFLASPKVGSGLKLFFSEFSNDDDDVSFCCTVSRKSKHEARCCYCEYEGTRIMHPAHPIENYCGGDMDFTEMAHGTHELTNARIISGGKWACNRVGMCGYNYIYFDPTRDAKFAQCMNRIASRANISWSDILRELQRRRLFAGGELRCGTPAKGITLRRRRRQW